MFDSLLFLLSDHVKILIDCMLPKGILLLFFQYIQAIIERVSSVLSFVK